MVYGFNILLTLYCVICIMAKNQSNYQIEMQIKALEKKVQVGVNPKSFWGIDGKIKKLKKQIRQNSWNEYLSK